MFREREKDLLNPPVLIVDNNRRECHRSRGAGGKPPPPPQLCYDMKARGVTIAGVFKSSLSYGERLTWQILLCNWIKTDTGRFWTSSYRRKTQLTCWNLYRRGCYFSVRVIGLCKKVRALLKTVWLGIGPFWKGIDSSGSCYNRREI